MVGRVSSAFVAAVIVAVLLGAGGAMGAPTPAPIEGSTRADPQPSPRAFVVKGSNEFEVIVYAAPAKRSGSGTVTVRAEGPTGIVSYSVRGDLAQEGIKANFGRFGRIDLHWLPSGAVRRTHGTCAGYPWSRFWDAGAYVGSFRFRGAGGFTEANTRRVVWRRSWYGPHSVCGVGISEGFPGPGKFLTAMPVGGGQSAPHLSVVQNGPREKVSCGAWMTEMLGRITVFREAFAEGKPAILTVPSSFRTGELSPPTPFSGTGHFERTEHAKGTWLGDLNVEFPDGFVQSLAGPSYEANLHSGFHEIEEE